MVICVIWRSVRVAVNLGQRMDYPHSHMLPVPGTKVICVLKVYYMTMIIYPSPVLQVPFLPQKFVGVLFPYCWLFVLTYTRYLVYLNPYRNTELFCFFVLLGVLLVCTALDVIWQEVLEDFLRLFPLLFSANQNARFCQAVTSSFERRQWKRLSAGLRNAAKMAKEKVRGNHCRHVSQPSLSLESCVSKPLQCIHNWVCTYRALYPCIPIKAFVATHVNELNAFFRSKGVVRVNIILEKSTGLLLYLSVVQSVGPLE